MRFKHSCLFVLTAIALCLMLASPVFSIVWSQSGQFNATSPILINWTTNVSNVFNGTVLLGNNFSSNLLLDVGNSTSNVKNSTGSAAAFYVYAWNGTQYKNTNQSNISAGVINDTTLLFSTAGLAPGRYNGTVSITNSTNSSDNVSVVVTLDIPVNLSTGIGSFSGNVTNSTYEIYYFNPSSITNVAGLVVNLTNLNGNVSVQLYDNASVLMNSSGTSSGNLTYVFGTSVPSSYWFINISNTSAAGNITFSGTIELKKASLVVNNSYDSNSADSLENITVRENRGINRTASVPITFTFPINNYAGYGVNIAITNSSSTLYNVNNPSYYMNFSSNITNHTLAASGSNVTQVNITVNTSATANQEGLYKGWMLFNATNGYPYTLFNLSFFIDLTHELNFTVNNVTNMTNGASSSAPGFNISINVTPRYQNGSVVPNIDTSAVNWSAWATHTSYSSLLNTTTRNVTINVTGITKDGNNYIVNGTVPSYAIGGNHTVYVYGKDNNTADLNTGIGASGNFSLNGTTLSLRGLTTSPYQGFCDGQAGLVSLSQGATFYCAFKVTNYGSRNATAVNVSMSMTSGCTNLNTSIPTTINLGTIQAEQSNTTTPAWYFNASSTGGCNITLSALASGTNTWDRQNLTIMLNMTGSSGTSGSESLGNISGTINKSLGISSWPAQTTVKQGYSATATVKIKNTGIFSLSGVRLDVSGIDKSWWSVSPSSNVSLAKNEEKSWIITFNVPKTATIANYTINYNAMANGVTTKSKQATLVVEPNSTMKTLINETLANYTVRYDEISALIEEADANGVNVTEATMKLAEAGDLLDQANAAIEQGDWTDAYSLLDQIDAKLTSAQASLTISKAGGGINIPWIWVGGVVGAAAIGVAAFYIIRLRQPGYYPELGYRSSVAPTGAARRIVEKIKNLFKKKAPAQTSAYSAYSASP